MTEKKAGNPEVGATAESARASRVLEKLIGAADVSKVYGEPTRHGDRLLLPAAEVFAAAGFGMGSGSGVAAGGRRRGGGGGAGGGGQAFSRSVAVIVSSPEGVTVEPVFDYTKIALAALTAAGFIWATWRSLAKPPRLFGR